LMSRQKAARETSSMNLVNISEAGLDAQAIGQISQWILAH
jgi:hypothetical protein